MIVTPVMAIAIITIVIILSLLLFTFDAFLARCYLVSNRKCRGARWDKTRITLAIIRARVKRWTYEFRVTRCPLYIVAFV